MAPLARPARQWRLAGPELPAAWPAEGLPLAWNCPIGGGYAGLAVAEGRVYSILARLTPEGYDEQSRTNIIQSGDEPIWSLPALTGVRIFARNEKEEGNRLPRDGGGVGLRFFDLLARSGIIWRLCAAQLSKYRGQFR